MVTQCKAPNGVDVLYIPNNRFHTNLVSVNFYMPLSKDTVSSYSLLSSIITTCSDEYRDFSLLNKELSRLYGADISSNISKVGDYLCVKFSVSTINDCYAFDGERPFTKSVKLLCKLLFEPKISHSSFEQEDIKRERRMLIEHINGEMNDKRLFARKRLIEEMFEDEPYGLFRLGNVDDILKLDGKDLYNAWQNMLKTAYVKVNIIGKDIPKDIASVITEKFNSIDRSCVIKNFESKPAGTRNEPKQVTEKMDVAQGKLVMGFTGDCGDDTETVSSIVTADIFGGGPYSRLFNNVREKMSLCYYCSCYSVRNKGYLVVDSGVELKNAEKAKEEILNQLLIIKDGKFDDYEFNASKKGICDSLLSANDSLLSIDAWYTVRALQKNILTPEELAEKIKGVTKKDVADAAQKIKLNTVYMLLPKEEK